MFNQARDSVLKWVNLVFIAAPVTTLWPLLSSCLVLNKSSQAPPLGSLIRKFFSTHSRNLLDFIFSSVLDFHWVAGKFKDYKNWWWWEFCQPPVECFIFLFILAKRSVTDTYQDIHPAVLPPNLHPQRLSLVIVIVIIIIIIDSNNMKICGWDATLNFSPLY